MRNLVATAGVARIARLALALVVALALGTALAQGADAERVRAQASIEVRVNAQRDNCELIGGGTLEVKPSPFQPGRSGGAQPNQVTTCTGGEYDGQTCTHTEKFTTCRQA